MLVSGVLHNDLMSAYITNDHHNKSSNPTVPVQSYYNFIDHKVKSENVSCSVMSNSLWPYGL